MDRINIEIMNPEAIKDAERAKGLRISNTDIITALLAIAESEDEK